MKIKKLLGLLLATVSPLLLQAQTTESFTFTTNRLVPDGNFSGLNDVRTVASAVGKISSLQVRLKVTGEFNGDLYAYLRNTNGFVVLLNRVGRIAANPGGYADSGFDVTFQAGAPNGDIHVYQNVVTPADGAPLTGIWQPDGRNLDPTSVTDSSTRSTSLTNFNGFSGAGEWTLYLADLESGGTNMLTEWGLDISGAATPTLSWTAPAAITYGTALSGTQLNATATYNSTNVPGTLTYSSPAGTVLSAGANQTISVTFTPSDTHSFLPITTNVALTVSPAPLTITANDANKVYGADLPAFATSYSGFVNGDTAASLTTPPTLGTTATTASPVGTYTITANGAVDANYSISSVNGTLTITQSLSAGVVTSSAAPALPGANVTFSMAVNAVAPGVGTPTGTVNFRIDGNIAGTGTLSDGRATFTINTLALGSHTVVAEYTGDLNFTGTTNALSQDQVVNTPPTAGNLTIERNPLTCVKVRLATLLANASDADGDTLNISVSSSSASNATITVVGGWVRYTPPAGFTNADSFTYTVTDGRGGSATGTVTVAVPVDNTQSQNLVIMNLGNNQFRIDGSGISGDTYRLQYSDTLAPFNWQDLTDGGVTADSTGKFTFIDTTAAPVRFYRSVYP
jgi:subtilisin-like proprotein convertase family protein